MEPAAASSRRIPLAIVGLVALALVALALSWTRHETGTGTVQLPGMHVDSEAVRVDAGAAQWRYLDFATVPAATAPLGAVPAPGRVVIDETRATQVFAPVPGRIEEVAVQLGQAVRQGDRLLAVRSSALPELNREAESARAALAVKTASYQRTKDLVALRAVAEKDLQVAEQERHDAELAVAAAEGKRASLKLPPLDGGGLFWLTAARSGSVVARSAVSGLEVGPDRADPLLVVADLSTVLVVADVLEADAAAIHPGLSARVLSPTLPSGGIPATVQHVSELVDPVRRTVGIRLQVPNQERALRPNAFVQVVLAPGGPRGVVVPSEAVVSDDQQAVVFVKTSPERLERRVVTVGRSRDGKTEVASGLVAGETIVTRGAILLLNAIDLTR